MREKSLTQIEKKGTQEKVRVAFSSLLAAIFLTLTKLIVGIITQSLGIISEAAHSALDLIAAGMTYFTVKRSDKPADAEHHYGHGKFENLSALLEAILLLITCAWIIFESIKRMFHPVKIKVIPISFVVLIIAIVVDFSRSTALSKMAKKYQSQALEAGALHFQSDIFSSLVVILGLVFVKFGLPVADPLAALGVALLVLRASWKLGKRTVDVLLDRAPEGLDQKIKEMIQSIPQVSSVSRLRLRRAGSHYFLDMNVMLEKDSSLEKAHQITIQIEEKVALLLPNSDVIVHTEPEEGGGFLEEKSELFKEGQEEKRIVLEILNQHFDQFVEFHDLTFRRTGDSRLVNLHLVVPKGIKIEDAHKLCDHLENDIKDRLGESEITIHIEPCEGECKTCEQECERKIKLKGKKKMMTKFKGKAWVAGDDIDTDQIYHGQYLPLTDPQEMKKHAMEFVPGFEKFSQQVKTGDIIVAGKNFGTGSSREHAVICLKENGVSCVVADSFARIFYRNAINLGFPLLECPGISKNVKTGDQLEIDTSSGEVRNLATGKTMTGRPLSGLELEITEKGGLLNYLKGTNAS